MKNSSEMRILIKTLSYRVCVVITLFLLAVFLGYGYEFAIKLVVVGLTVGFLIFWGHEKIWSYTRLWIINGYDLHRRTIAKTITWRITSLIVLFTLGILFGLSSNDALEWTISSNIMFVLVHYLHERAWNLIKWGKILYNS